jgi:hypothetical protein
MSLRAFLAVAKIVNVPEPVPAKNKHIRLDSKGPC